MKEALPLGGQVQPTAMFDRPKQYEVVVIGAGQAGVSLSFFLKKLGIEHVVLEKDRPFSAWRNRWDGFYANTPNWMNVLPRASGAKYPGHRRDGFATREELIEYFERYLEEVDAPVLCDQYVIEARQATDDSWIIRTRSGGTFEARNLVVCTGSMSKPRVPDVASSISPRIAQRHSQAYRRPSDIQSKQVLVVGSGSSGVQICKELLDAGCFDEVHLATSDVLVLPSHVLGIQIHRLLHLLGLFDVKVHSRLGRLMYRNLEFKGDPIRPPTPKDLGRSHGLVVHGRLVDADGDILHFGNGDTLHGADLTIVWSTGFKGDYRWIRTSGAPLEFDERDYPVHLRGVVDKYPGLFFVGLRYQYTVASHDIYGVGNDAEFIATQIQLRRKHPLESYRKVATQAT